MASAALALVLALACWPASSDAGVTPCGEVGFVCSQLSVPLDRATHVPGAITLSVARKFSAAGPSRNAVVALAGGPGQAALPLGKFISEAIAPALGSRDLLVFDQRGTGHSDPLSCPIFSNLAAAETASPSEFPLLVEQCALELGAPRGAYTSEESVQDIETLRAALGYEKLVLYGTSYGTKVALEYAERYPEHVEALVLDSVVPPTGREPFGVPSFQAIAPVLEELCAASACAGITSNPLGDLTQLTAQLRAHPLRGFAYDGSGHRHAISMSELDLWRLLAAGDLDPALRALLPAAVRSALAGDSSPLLRLLLLAQGFIPNLPSGPIDPEAELTAAEEEDNALFWATTCEESAFPWQRSASAPIRAQEALAALNAVPGSAFAPFDASTALHSEPILECEHWPDASPTPPSAGQLPDVPTLIFSGEQDLRTPTAYARAIAAEIPDAQLLLVPFTGHSVIGSDLSDCSAQAIAAFFARDPVQQCANSPDEFSPTPITPTRLSSINPPSGLHGRAGQTLVAVLDTLVDLNRQLIAATIQADRELPSGSSFGGLRGGFAKITSAEAILRDFSFVPGVEITATFPIRHHQLEPANIRVFGRQAAAGTVRFGAQSTKAVGTLAGRHFAISIAKVKLSRVDAGEWPSLTSLDRLLARAHAEAFGHAGPAPRLP